MMKISLKDLEGKIDKNKTVSVVSCNGCAQVCKTGGRKELDTLASKLQSKGFKVVDKTLVGICCSIKHIKPLKIAGEQIVLLSCSLGTYLFSSCFKGIKIIPGLRTVGAGVFTEDNSIGLLWKFGD